MDARLLQHENRKIVKDFREANRQLRDYAPEGVVQIGAEALWNETKGEGTVVAILDTGIDRNHPDLKDNIIGGYNFTPDYNGDTTNFEDNQGHGTHVAGTIAGIDNHEGVVGVAPKAKILALKVLSGNGSGSTEWITSAIHYAIDWRGPNNEQVNVINMSLGSKAPDENLHNAIKEAVAHDIAVIVAAGNDGDGNINTEEDSYPAMYPEVISVGAVDFKRNVTAFSNDNKEVDVCADGFNILSTFPHNQYAILSGTSMATPHVVGLAALFRGKFFRRFGRYPSEQELYCLIKFHTIDIADAGVDAGSGAGYVTALTN